MADVKISALPASTVALAGTEVLPIVQSSTTKQVSVANLTAGRAVDTLNLSTSGSTSTTPVLGFNASNCNIASGATVASTYLQAVMQNKSGTAGASTNYVLSNDLGTDSTYYGEFGMNSSVFSASTPVDFFSINNGVYFSAHDGDVSVGSGNGFKTYFAWGTTGQSAHVINATGALGFSTNLGTTPALSGTTGFGTAGQALVSAGAAAAPAWGTLGVAGGGTGLTTLTANYIPYGNGTSAFASSANLTFTGSFLSLLGTSAFGASAVRRSSFYFESANRALTATTANLAIGVTDAFGIDVGGQIALSGKYDGTADQIPFGVIKGAKENVTSGNLAGYLAFGTSGSGGGFAEAMRISSTQGVSIGNTTNPGAGNLSVTGTVTANPPSAVFASLPTASTVSGKIYRATDVGINGSLWQSNGTSWVSVSQRVVNLQANIPFIVPSSGSITVTTGALLLTTALDQIYPNCYMYFPAGSWTSSTAGFYYVVMSSTTAGLVYSDKYTSGQPTIPAAPTLVTTGAGAYVQTTGASLTAFSITVPGNTIGANGKFSMALQCVNNNSATSKYYYTSFGGNSQFYTGQTTNQSAPINIPFNWINRGVANKQFVIQYPSLAAQSGTQLTTATTIDTTTNQTASVLLYLNAVTDWCGVVFCSIATESMP